MYLNKPLIEQVNWQNRKKYLLSARVSYNINEVKRTLKIGGKCKQKGNILSRINTEVHLHKVNTNGNKNWQHKLGKTIFKYFDRVH